MNRRGFRALSRYLEECWQRSGFDPGLREDATQEALLDMAGRMGVERFAAIVDAMGSRPIGDVLPRGSAERKAFIRSIWRVAAKSRRAKRYRPLGESDPAPVERGLISPDLGDAIRMALDAREAGIIGDTLRGMGPGEIAARLGVAPKTVSNLKHRAFGKLRAVLS